LEKIKNYIEARDRDLEFAGEHYVYMDLAVSGADPVNIRPEFSRLCDDAEYYQDERPFDIVIVYKLDRFARKLEVLLDVTRILDELRL
jgi:DNA invertase Pin-like site-specific DNA recombinase